MDVMFARMNGVRTPSRVRRVRVRVDSTPFKENSRLIVVKSQGLELRAPELE